MKNWLQFYFFFFFNLLRVNQNSRDQSYPGKYIVEVQL